MSARIEVQLGQRSYDIHVASGGLADAGSLLKPFAADFVPVVTDRHVAARHLDALTVALEGAGLEAKPIILEPGEGEKSFEGLERVCTKLLQTGIERGGLVVAFGGGVVGDLTGFASGVLKRGIDYAQIPTTLLSQVDSAVGGKTAINTKEGKNLVGLFHQPRVVIADTDLLATLPHRELRGGYAEVVKYGALGDAAFFHWLETHGAAALRGEPDKLEYIVAHSCRTKAGIVMRDERETGERALLNLGHTFGHALEAATGYSARLLHGEAVAIGMALAFRLSAKLRLAPQQDAERLARHLRDCGLPASIGDFEGPRPDADTLLGHMMHDKKAKSGKLVFVLVRGLGQAFTTTDVPEDAVRAVLEE